MCSSAECQSLRIVRSATTSIGACWKANLAAAQRSSACLITHMGCGDASGRGAPEQEVLQATMVAGHRRGHAVVRGARLMAGSGPVSWPEIRACRLCRDPDGKPLPHEAAARGSGRGPARGFGIFGQAPGTRVHASGTPSSIPRATGCATGWGSMPMPFTTSGGWRSCRWGSVSRGSMPTAGICRRGGSVRRRGGPGSGRSCPGSSCAC